QEPGDHLVKARRQYCGGLRRVFHRSCLGNGILFGSRFIFSEFDRSATVMTGEFTGTIAFDALDNFSFSSPFRYGVARLFSTARMVAPNSRLAIYRHYLRAWESVNYVECASH